MTLIDSSDDVVYEIALCEHPLVVGEDDDRTDEELISEVEARTTVADDLTFRGWTVFVSYGESPGEEDLRYVNTKTRFNVLAPYTLGSHKKKYDVFDALVERIEIEGFDVESAEFSYWTTHPDDFDGEIHLDLTE